jgi:hypothetical protein
LRFFGVPRVVGIERNAIRITAAHDAATSIHPRSGFDRVVRMAEANQIAAFVVAGIVVDVVNIDSRLNAPLALTLRA